ncbi:helix-turn-helix domain-containing protein [Dactylosporangium sp. NPDC000244]|uniref:TetR/AcrR family transcriptional regulator n=1 Tax=Dactylosporangium sp. NPDC000244 TaxID=3154365 RepID=UPI003334A280
MNARRDEPSDTELRERVLDALRELLDTRTFDSLSVAEIIAAAGVSRASFYFYFPSKQAALAELVRRAVGAGHVAAEPWLSSAAPSADPRAVDASAGPLPGAGGASAGPLPGAGGASAGPLPGAGGASAGPPPGAGGASAGPPPGAGGASAGPPPEAAGDLDAARQGAADSRPSALGSSTAQGVPGSQTAAGLPDALGPQTAAGPPEALGPREALRHGIAAGADLWLANAGVLRAIVESWASDAQLRELWLAQMDTFTAATLARIADDPGLEGVDLPALAASLTWLGERLYYLAASRIPPFDDREVLVDTLTHLWIRALGVA